MTRWVSPADRRTFAWCFIRSSGIGDEFKKDSRCAYWYFFGPWAIATRWIILF